MTSPDAAKAVQERATRESKRLKIVGAATAVEFLLMAADVLPWNGVGGILFIVLLTATGIQFIRKVKSED